MFLDNINVGVPTWLGDQDVSKRKFRYPSQKKKKGLKLPRFISLEDVVAMIKASQRVYEQANPYYDKTGNPTLRNKVLIELLFFTGVRNRELRLMEIQQVDFNNKMIKVFGKGKKQRLIPIPQFVLDDIKEYVGDRKDGHIIIGMGADGFISERHVERIVKRCAKEGGVRHWREIHPHTLRHSYATYLRNNGYGLDEIQILLGHSRLETTRIYSHLGVSQLFKKVADTFEGFGLH